MDGRENRGYGQGKVVRKIDPDVDDTRAYLIQNLLYSQGLLSFGHMKGIGVAAIMQPRVNLNGDPYITDGYLAVLWVSSKPNGFEKPELVQWEKFRPYEEVMLSWIRATASSTFSRRPKALSRK